MLFPAALLRLIDADEGYYLLASKLVLQGKALYADFLYPQMPLLPYVYGVWLQIFGVSWYSGRSLSALCAVLLGGLLYCHAARRFGGRMGLLAVLLYTFSGLVLGWYTVVKTYSLSTVFLFAAYAVLLSNMPRSRRQFLCGALFGLAVDTRLLFLGAAFAFLIWLFITESDFKSALHAQMRFLSGTVVALLPNAAFILADPDTYFFNNIWFHSIRISSRGLVGDLDQKLAAIKQLFGVFAPGGVSSLQFVMLFVLNVVYFIRAGRARHRLSLAFYIAVCLAIANLLPSPTFDQYFSVLIPFMIINGLHLLSQFNPRSEVTARGLRRGLTALVAIYVAVAPLEFYRYVFWGRDVPGVGYPENAINWTIATVNSVASEIDRRVARNERVLTWWPGYLVESHAAAFPKAETHFGLEVSDRLIPKRLDRYRIMSHGEMYDILKEHRTRVVVIGNWIFAGMYRETLRRSGYVSIKRIGDTEIYVWPGGKAGSPGPPSG